MTGTKMPHLAIVGAGPAGLGAAIGARRAGLRVTLIDDQLEPGGQIWRSAGSTPIDHARSLGAEYMAGRERIGEFLSSGAEYLAQHTLWQIEYEADRPVLYCAGPGGSRVLRPDHALLATGAVERPTPVPGWTSPGVMTAGGLQILLKSARLCPDRAVLAGAGPLLWLLAAQMIEAGTPPLALVETVSASSYLAAVRFLPKALRQPAPLKKGIGLIARVVSAGVPVYRGARDLRVHGDGHVQALSFKTWSGAEKRIEAETIGLHHGVVPNQQASRLLRLPHEWVATQHAFVPKRDHDMMAAPRLFLAGDGAGIGGADVAWLEGQIVAGIVSGRDVGEHRRSLALSKAARPFIDRLYLPAHHIRHPADDTIVCRCESVTAGQIRQAVRDSATGPNQVKFMLRPGMGPCQGRVCGLAVSETVAQCQGKDMKDAGYFRIRPPLKPIGLSIIATAPQEAGDEAAMPDDHFVET